MGIKLLVLFIGFASFMLSDKDWKKSMEKDEIIVYTREVETSSFHEFLAEAEMKGTKDRFRKIITDFDNYPNWLPDCNSARAIDHPSKDDFTYHMKLKVPFPFANRDIIQQIVLSESSDELVVEITSRPKKIKEEKNYVRMEEAGGRWIIRDVSEDHVLVKFQYFADPGGEVPSWLVNTFIVKNPHKTLQNLREMMAKY